MRQTRFTRSAVFDQANCMASLKQICRPSLII